MINIVTMQSRYLLPNQILHYLGSGFILTAFQVSIAVCMNCQVEKNIPPKTQSRAIPGLSPLHRAPHPSSDITLEGSCTSDGNGGFPEPVSIHGCCFRAPNMSGCFGERSDKRFMVLLHTLMSGTYPGNSLESSGNDSCATFAGPTGLEGITELTWFRSLKSSKGAQKKASTAPAAMPANIASE